MGQLKFIISAAALTVALQGCAGQDSKKPDYDGIMDRTVDVFLAANQELEANGLTSAADDATMNVFTEVLHSALNADPKLYATPMGLELLEDASFKGFDDKNNDNKQDIGEEKLFTLEIDPENDRLVCTDYTGGHHGYSLGMGGFFAGAILGNMMNRQRTAGVNPGRYTGTNMKSTSRAKMASRNARSSSRSGGARSGK